MSDAHHHSSPDPSPSYDPGPSAALGHQQMMHDMAHREFMNSDPSVAKSWDGKRTVLTAYALWLFLGWAGAHRFYVGRWRSALGMAAAGLVTWIMTTMLGPWLGIPMTIWWIVDALLVPGWIKQANAANAAKTQIVETV